MPGAQCSANLSVTYYTVHIWWNITPAPLEVCVSVFICRDPVCTFISSLFSCCVWGGGGVASPSANNSAQGVRARLHGCLRLSALVPVAGVNKEQQVFPQHCLVWRCGHVCLIHCFVLSITHLPLRTLSLSLEEGMSVNVCVYREQLSVSA